MSLPLLPRLALRRSIPTSSSSPLRRFFATEPPSSSSPSSPVVLPIRDQLKTALKTAMKAKDQNSTTIVKVTPLLSLNIHTSSSLLREERRAHLSTLDPSLLSSPYSQTSSTTKSPPVHPNPQTISPSTLLSRRLSLRGFVFALSPSRSLSHLLLRFSRSHLCSVWFLFVWFRAERILSKLPGCQETRSSGQGIFRSDFHLYFLAQGFDHGGGELRFSSFSVLPDLFSDFNSSVLIVRFSGYCRIKITATLTRLLKELSLPEGDNKSLGSFSFSLSLSFSSLHDASFRPSYHATHQSFPSS